MCLVATLADRASRNESRQQAIVLAVTVMPQGNDDDANPYVPILLYQFANTIQSTCYKCIKLEIRIEQGLGFSPCCRHSCSLQHFDRSTVQL